MKYEKGVSVKIKRKHKRPMFGMTINGVVMHRTGGEEVKVGDLVAGEVYKVNIETGLTTQENKS